MALDKQDGDTNTTTTALDVEALICAKRRGAHHYEKVVNQLRADGVTYAEIAQAMANARDVISPGRLPPAARGQRRATAELAEHATEIRRLREQVVEDVIEIGNRLTECKKLCAHGAWIPWLKNEFGWTEQTALNLMRVKKLIGKSKKFLDLNLPVSALYLLAAPSTPEAAKTEVIARAEAGEVLPVAEVKGVIKAHKEPAPAKSVTVDTTANTAKTATSTTAKTAKNGAAPDEKTARAETATTTQADVIIIKSREHAADCAAHAFDTLDVLIEVARQHPDWVDADHLGERLQTKASAFIELAQRARGGAKRTPGGGK